MKNGSLELLRKLQSIIFPIRAISRNVRNCYAIFVPCSPRSKPVWYQNNASECIRLRIAMAAEIFLNNKVTFLKKRTLRF